MEANVFTTAREILFDSASEVDAHDERASAQSKPGGGATYNPEARRKPDVLERKWKGLRVNQEPVQTMVQKLGLGEQTHAPSTFRANLSFSMAILDDCSTELRVGGSSRVI